MKPLTPEQTHHVAGGMLRTAPPTEWPNWKSHWDTGAFAPATDELLLSNNTSPLEQDSAVRIAFSLPNGTAILLQRFDENFLASGDRTREDAPLFAGFDDQSGVD